MIHAQQVTIQQTPKTVSDFTGNQALEAICCPFRSPLNVLKDQIET
jgi:hypothetical protein